MMMMIMIIIKVIYCFSFAWCLLIQNSSEEGCSVIYWTSTNFNIFIINCLLSFSKEESKEVLKKYSADFGGADQQFIAFGKRSQVANLEYQRSLANVVRVAALFYALKLVAFFLGHNWSISGISQSLL